MSISNDRLVLAVKKEDGTIQKTLVDVPVSSIVGDTPGPKKPIVSITFSPEKPNKGDTVNLDGSKSRAGAEGSTITSYAWSGVGNITNADQALASFVFPQDRDSVNISLHVVDSDGQENTRTITISTVIVEPPKEEKIALVTAVASAQDAGKEAVKAIDNDFETRWSVDGKGQWIELAFPRSYKVTKVALTGYWYDRAYMFSIAGKDFTNPANRPPNTLQEYDLRALNITSNKLRIIGNGNSQSEYNSYRKIEVYGIPTDEEPPGDCPSGQCKDPTTQQCRALAADEEIDQNGFCRKKEPEPEPVEGDINILSVSDNDTTPDASNVYRAMSTYLPHTAVQRYWHCGDIPYAGNAQQAIKIHKDFWSEQEAQEKWRLSKGNHDCKESEADQTQIDLENYFQRYKPKDPNKTLMKNLWLEYEVIGNLFHINMDSSDLDVEFRDREQYNWVKDVVAPKVKELRANGTIDWVIVTFHKPLFTLKTSHSPYTSVRFLYKDLFAEMQVDIVNQGHNHNKQYWLPMVPNASDQNAAGDQLFQYIPGTKIFDRTKPMGYIVAINGDGGHEFNNIDENGAGVNNVMYYKDGAANPHTSSNKFGFTRFHIAKARPKLLIVQGIDTDKQVEYEFKISREGSEPQPENLDAKLKELIGRSDVGKTYVVDGSQSTGNITNWSITQDPGDATKVNLQDSSLKYSKQFIMPDTEETLHFTLSVSDGTETKTDSQTVKKSLGPGPQPGGQEIWNSNIHLKTGQQYTISGTHGSQDADGKGVFTAASGSPKVVVDPDGTFHLVCKPGHGRMYGQACNHNSVMKGMIMIETDSIDSCTLRLRTRHNEGGDCSNRFGGMGCSIYQGRDKEYEFDCESCHNNHENNKKKAWTAETSMQVGKWYEFEYSCCDDKDKKIIRQRLVVKHPNTTMIWNESHNTPQAYYMDEALHAKRSMFWLRMNNASQDGSIAFKNIQIFKLEAGALDP